ncbi:glycosyltransferase family 2 protein [Arsenicicoccus dermatophilus]|uniref:glycosyltransferase family 2 protein n=1 Tax=Arsenicicoccus dermatophilus TaxID=1076331 RepID=UPI001F4C84F3|nr:galactosyltransferase-related protein [Arsenicicoccus dermatophilus]MCH8611937.1 glycosyltransferase family 2 protein [Arsenicicoccus dermatophilus]
MSGPVLVTVAAGRHDHLLAQRRHVAALPEPPRHVVVSMGDPAIGGLLADAPPEAPVEVLDIPLAGSGRLPLAEARNAGTDRALALGADLVVLLDVDCLPGPQLVRRYAAAARELGADPALLCGQVTYLPAQAGAPEPEDLARWRSPHAARPAPADGELVRGGEHRLFWSLSFAVTPATWRRVGGFCTDYDGYGGEDTDLGLTAREAAVELVWVGGADAYHQHHPVSSPPVEHLDDILRNAATFHRRWGVWPMEGWLRAFAERGLAVHDEFGWHRA